MPEMHEDPVGYWNDRAGRNWVNSQVALDETMRGITAHTLSAADPQPGERVLDVGCGCGTTSIACAEAVGPSGQVLGVDVSEPMLAHARNRAKHLPWVRFDTADAATYSFDGKADLLYSRFGVMFFLEPEPAFANLRRALRPGGRMVFACWQEPAMNPWMSFVMTAFPEIERSPPPVGPGPFSMRDGEATRRLVEQAGFEDVTLTAVDQTMPLGPTVDDALAVYSDVGPLARLLADAEPDERSEITRRAHEFLVDAYESAAGPPAPAAAIWLVTARG